MRILIVQTARMGDTLQTSPLIRMVRNKYPDAHITVMVRGMGKIICERHPDVNDIIVYNEDDMYLDMRSRDSDRLLKAYQSADAIARELRSRNFDLAYNATHSVSSAMLLRLAGIGKVIGADFGAQGEFVLRGDWVNYFFTSVISRDYNDLNLCDISRNFEPDATPCRELIFQLTDSDRNFAAALWNELGIRDDDFVACMQLGASEVNKRWSEERFAELAQLLRERRNARILLLGVNEEATLGARFESLAPGIAKHLFGKTSVPQVSAVLERANVLVTNDTGTMHLAAAVRCPIVLVSVGHVHYRETGPFGEGHAAIEWRKERLGQSDRKPAEADDRQRISAEQVYTVLDYLMAQPRSGSVLQLPDSDLLGTVDVYVTRTAPDGCLQFYPAIARPLEERDIIRIAYRAMWLRLLAGRPTEDAISEGLRQMLGSFLLPEPDTTANTLQALLTQFDGLASIAQRGVAASDTLIAVLKGGGPMARARDAVRELTRLDEEARIHSELHPACRPLAKMARFERDNLEGADPLPLAITARGIHASCVARARGVAQVLQQIHATLLSR